MVDLSRLPFLLRPCCSGYYGTHVQGCMNHPDTVIEFQRIEPLLWEGYQS